MKTPQFLQQLMSSSEYMDKNSKAYAMAERYLNLLYPGVVQTDATGRMTEPEYDMTFAQFNEAQKQIDADFEEAKDEAEEEILDEYGEYFENLGISFDIDACVIPGESIPVKVLYGDDVILVRHLETYDLDIPNFEKVRKIWIWHGEVSETTCDECESLDGQTFYDEDDIPECPVHPNCRCWVEEIEIDEDGNVISRSRFAANQPAVASKAPEKTASTPEEKATFAKPVNTKPGYYAVFDGKKFTVYVDNKPVISWDAVSGRPGYQSPEYQNKESTGPIPEGIYVARQEGVQHITPIGFMAGLIPGKHGEWPGSTISWGDSRVWLEPSQETNTYGRDRFSIHGGWFSGSAGCIDLTSQIDNFVALFGFIGKDLIVNVQY